MKLKQRKNIAKFTSNIYGAFSKVPTRGKLLLTDSDCNIDVNGKFKILRIKFNGNVRVSNKLPDGFSIKIANNNILSKNIKDGLLFTFLGDFTPYFAEILTLTGQSVELEINNQNIAELINFSKSKIEDDSLIFIDEGDNLSDVEYNQIINDSSIDDDTITGLYSNKPFADGYQGYYNFHPKEKIFMTGKILTNQSVPIGTTLNKFNSPKFNKAANKIFNKIYKKVLSRNLNVETNEKSEEITKQSFIKT